MINNWCYHLIKKFSISLDQHVFWVCHLINNLISAGVSLDQHISEAFHLTNTHFLYTVSLDQQNNFQQYHLTNKKLQQYHLTNKKRARHHLINKKVHWYHLINKKSTNITWSTKKHQWPHPCAFTMIEVDLYHWGQPLFQSSSQPLEVNHYHWSQPLW